MNTADRFVATLEHLGVDTFFGLPGSTEAALLEALRASGRIRYVLGLHESAVVAMADGYARATGRVGVAGLHTTVGTMNGLSQLYNASRDGVPVLLTVGHKDRTVLAEDGFCALPDLPGLARQFAKHSWQSLSSEAVPADLVRAHLAAATPPTGPAFLAIPDDLLAAPAPEHPGPLPGAAVLERWGAPDQAVVEALAGRLLRARRPRLVLGGAAASASAAAQELAQATGLGVLAADLTDLSCCSYPRDESHYLGVYGEEQAALEGCDLLLAVGCRVFFPFSARRRPELPPGAALVHLHPDPAELGKRSPTDLALVGEPGAWLRALAVACRAQERLNPSAARREAELAPLQEHRRRRLASEVEAARGGDPVTVEEVAAELAPVLPRGTILVEEGVRASRAIFRHCGVPESGAIWRSSGGSLGWGLPAAVGAKLGAPERPVVLLVGDGSLHFSIQALWTAVQQGAPLVAVVLDNRGYLAVKRAIENLLQLDQDPREHPGTELAGIDHVLAARAYGATGVRVRTAAEAAEAVEAALAQGGVSVVEVPVAQIRP